MDRVLQSSRLYLQPCTDADVNLLTKHWTEPMVRRYLFDDRIIDRETVEQFIISSSASFQRNGYGLWTLLDKLNGEFQGICGLYDETPKSPDLLYSIATPYWGRGLATESAQCILHYAFTELRLQQITATVDKPNSESIRVLEKIGMILVEERLINGNPILHYSLACEEYCIPEAGR